MKISDRKWKSFKVTDVFDEIERGKRLKNADHIKGDIPYVASSALNNGVTDFVKETSKTRSFNDCISLANSGSIGTAFYEPFKFVASDHITHLKRNGTSQDEYLFLATMLEKQQSNFGFNREINDPRIKALKIMLPINNQGCPDFEFIREFVHEHYKTLRDKYNTHVQKQIKLLGNAKHIIPLNKKNWYIFRIDNIFNNISRPPARSKKQYEDGDIPFVASGASLNGAVKFCKPHTDETLDDWNCITVSPVDGSAFYQPMQFLGRGGGGSSIIMLRSPKLNKYNGLFLAKAITNTTSKYQYGHMSTSDGIKRDRILLPVNDQGTPDYQYMEQYTKNMMIKKYTQYMNFINE